jgi:hypothetical protein
MQKLIKVLFTSILVVALSSCQTLSVNDFVYMGHPKGLDDYSLYYDTDRDLFLLLDSNGCFYKSSDYSGTCLAFDHQSAENFRKNVLTKMIDINNKTFEPKNKVELLSLLKKMKMPSIEKPINVDFKVKRIKQININNKKEYHLVTGEYNLKAKIILIKETDSNTAKNFKIFYSLTLPDAVVKQKTSTRPFIIEPNYLFDSMQASAVEKAKSSQNTYYHQVEEISISIIGYLEHLGA